MIPIRDDNPARLVPFVTFSLIILNVAVFIYQSLQPRADYLAFLYNYGAIPDLIIRGENLHAIATSMFLHGGLLHLLGNMLYLWIFGDNVEGLCGHWRFFVFYLLCGLIAFSSHFIVNPFSPIPMVGASGAISGILGAYALRFPHARVHILFPLFPFVWIWRTAVLPAVLVLGLWFLLQIFNALFSATSSSVAWLAHIGGFVGGLYFIRKFEKQNYYVRYK